MVAPITEETKGKIIFFRKFLREDFLQATKGHIPVSNSNAKAMGVTTALKKGAPTVIFIPRMASDMIGKSVPKSIAKAIPTRSRLLYRKLLSFESKDSSWFLLLSSGSR